MAGLRNRINEFYGANPLQLLVLLACFALTGYVVVLLGPSTLLNSMTWWQSIVVWFFGAIVLHDLVLLPLYALADRSLAGLARALRPARDPVYPRVSAANHLRIPALSAGLLFVLFFPGIVEQGSSTYQAATGQTQDPFLERWLLVVAVMFGLSAIIYVGRLAVLAGPEPDASRAGDPDASRAEQDDHGGHDPTG